MRSWIQKLIWRMVITNKSIMLVTCNFLNFVICFHFSFSAAIAEMLVQSTVKDLYLLPALPRYKWANGCVKGLKARGGVTVNVCWKEGDLHEVGLWSKEHHSIKQLHYRGTTVNANLSPGRVYTFNRQLRCIKTYALPSATSYWR
jgi:alpha-L-fucosidase 2